MLKKTLALLTLGILVGCVVAFVGAQESSRRRSGSTTSTYSRGALANRLQKTQESPAPPESTAATIPESGAESIQPIPSAAVTNGARRPASPAPIVSGSTRISRAATAPTSQTPPPSSSPRSSAYVADARGASPASPVPVGVPIQSQSDVRPAPAGIVGTPSTPAPAPTSSPFPTRGPTTSIPTPAIPAPSAAMRPRQTPANSSAYRPSAPPMERVNLSAKPTRPSPESAVQGPAYKTSMLNGPSGSNFESNPNPQPQIVDTPMPKSDLDHASLQEEKPGVLMNIPGPALSVYTEGPRAIVIGKQASYVITVENQGRDPATNLSVRVAIPEGVRLDDMRATTGSAEETTKEGKKSREFIWKVGQVAASDTEDLELQVTPTANRPFGIEAEWTMRSAARIAHVEVQQPLLEVQIVGAREMLYGTTKVYNIIVSNPGSGAAENVSVDLGAGTAQAGTKQIGLLGPGEKRELELELTPRDVGIMEIHARAVGDGGLQNEALQEVTVRRPALKIAATGPKLKYAGTPGDYTITVSNAGDATANNVTVSIGLPRGSEYLSGLDGAQMQDGTLTMNVGQLGAGMQKQFDIRCALNDAGEVRLVAATRGDGDLAASTDVITTVEAIADIRMVVHDPPGPIPTGREVVYELHITNRGKTAANNVEVIAQFSEGIEPTQAGGQAAKLLEDGQVWFQPIRRLGQGESIVLKVNAKASQGGLHRFRAELTCKDPETRLVTEDSTKYFDN